MKPRAITVQQIAEARVLRSDLGWTYSRIAKTLGVNSRTVIYQLQRGRQLEIREIARRMYRTAANSVEIGRVQKISRGFTAKALERRLIGQGRCAVTGRLFEYVSGSEWLPSCDRLDHTGPYSMANIQLVSKVANMARQSMTMVEFIEFCRDVVHFAGNQVNDRETSEAFRLAK